MPVMLLRVMRKQHQKKVLTVLRVMANYLWPKLAMIFLLVKHLLQHVPRLVPVASSIGMVVFMVPIMRRSGTP